MRVGQGQFARRMILVEIIIELSQNRRDADLLNFRLASTSDPGHDTVLRYGFALQQPADDLGVSILVPLI